MDDRKLAEFNYKIINNILLNKAYLSKWTRETNAKSSFCNQKEDTIHLLTIVPSMITFGILLVIVYNLTLHINMLS